jgi:hypothetical protein
MSLIKQISKIFSFSKGSDDRAYWIVAKCNRCGEVIKARIDLSNDLSIDYDNSAKGTNYFCRKTLIGAGHCFQRVEVELSFDSNRKVIDRKISGGKFLEEEK